MPGTEQTNDDLQAAICGHTILIRVSGRGSFKVAAPLKQFITKMASEQPVLTVAIDLNECIGMDSTFMGVLAGLSGRLRKTNQTLEVINLSSKNADLLKTLGVDQVLSFYENSHGHRLAGASAESVPTDQASQKEMAETALLAHEKLVEVCTGNQPRFKQVIELLKEDVDRLS